jgi:hypothetical protein
MTEPLANGHDKTEATLAEASDITGSTMSVGSVIMEEHLHIIQRGVALAAEKATIETLVQDAMRRYVKAMEAGNHRAAIEATREIFRLELYLSRRGFV